MFPNMLQQIGRWWGRSDRRTPERRFGDRGEQYAARFLKRQGIRVLTRNYLTSRGEIDLVCRDRDVLVFVEVKTRQRGEPLQAVNHRKRQRLVRAGKEFLRMHGLPNHQPFRFDVIGIIWPEKGATQPELQYYRAAFHAGDL